jgi:hypothetical protein
VPLSTPDADQEGRHADELTFVLVAPRIRSRHAWRRSTSTETFGDSTIPT